MWAWDWGWGWAMAVGVIVVLGVALLPWFFFLLNLQTTLGRVSERNRAMPPAHVWLNFIPIFNLGWFLYTVTKVTDSLRAEYQSRGWAPEGDFGYAVGLAAGVLAIASFFMGWVPVLGWLVAIALLVCWILYWLKVSDVKSRLAGAVEPFGRARYSEHPGGPWPPGAATPGPGDSAGASQGDSPPESAFAPSPGKVASGPQQPEEGGQCAVCGGSYSAGDRFCRTCGLRLL